MADIDTMRAADFMNTIGVNTHIGADPYNDPNQIGAMLDYLGIEHVRNSAPTDAAATSNLEAIAADGAKIDLIINGGGPVSLSGNLAMLDSMAPSLEMIEGPNEVAIWPIQYDGLGGVDAAVAFQKDLYTAVKGDPSLAGLPVLMFTLGGVDPAAFPQIGDLSAYADFANVHSYPTDGMRPIFVLHAAVDGGSTDAPSLPVMITETGYYTLPGNTGWGGVTEAVQADYTLDLLLDEAAAGIARTYVYDLIDDAADPSQSNREAHFGLFHYDGTPKLAAVALHNMSTILADPGAGAASFSPGQFGYTVAGLPYDYTGNSLVIDKSDGSHVIAVWNEQQLWTPSTQTPTAAKDFPITVTLDHTYDTVKVYDPMVGTSPVQELHDTGSLKLDLYDHPLFIDVAANASAASTNTSTANVPSVSTPVSSAALASTGTASTGTASTPSVSTGPASAGSLSLLVAEDAYHGDAQFIVSVNGQQLGTFTATTAHGSGSWQEITLTGDFSAAQSVGVQFFNDANGADGDRNLYVQSLTLNGATYHATDATNDAGLPLSDAAALYWNGTLHFDHLMG